MKEGARMNEILENATYIGWLLRWRKGPQAKELRQPLEVEESMETYSLLESPERIQSGQHLDFSQQNSL